MHISNLKELEEYTDIYLFELTILLKYQVQIVRQQEQNPQRSSPTFCRILPPWVFLCLNNIIIKTKVTQRF
ncbi:hypothetical protein AQUCO_00600451v1 [Aquilegia coerulea]|uniref:Uncharacterized protein n=1 Tax=Aquilegia coerulea TaxID=218851 RepID=A0A2G5EPT2_AQUCA|nr:hypothetical protein AQUCO_00600451v1 [Aquilegia coerulea]